MTNYNYYDKKYADLIVNKCFVNDGKKPLLIIYDGKNLEKFANVCFREAKKAGFNHVYLFDEDIARLHKYINNTSVEKLDKYGYLNRSLEDECAKLESNILFLETVNDIEEIDENKQYKVDLILGYQQKTLYENVNNYKCPWCIVSYPNTKWAKKIYPYMSEDEAYERLYLNIMKMCMINKKNPSNEWDKKRKAYQIIADKLNALSIRRLHYSNKLGTDLRLGLPQDHLWLGSSDNDFYGNNIMVNMPSYEIFTSPLYDETEGIVYSSMPLNYNKIIDRFSLKFKKGCVSDINTSSKEDYKILNDIIKYDEGASYLGECSLVENSSPVHKTKTLYYNTLYDENSSCHLALGNGFPNSIIDGSTMSDEDLDDAGINLSGMHVDFMIGTDDLKIEADTKYGKKLIYSKGKIVI